MRNITNQKYETKTISNSPELKVCHQSANGSLKGSIIFIHGICHGAWCFEKFMDFFSKNGYECFALNLRGHGDNNRKGLTFARLSQYMNDVEKCVDFVVKCLQEKGITEKPFLLGHSMGGAVVQKYIKKYFGEVKGLILFASATAKRMPYFKTLFGLRKKNLRTAALKAWGAKVSDEDIAGAAFFDNRIKSMNDIVRYNKLLHRESLVITFVSLYLPYYKGKYNGNIPIFVIGSDKDTYFPTDSLNTTANFYDTKPMILRGLCHDMMLDPEWEKAAESVLEFIENPNKLKQSPKKFVDNLEKKIYPDKTQ